MKGGRVESTMRVDPSRGLSEGHAIGLCTILAEFRGFAPHGLSPFVASTRFPEQGHRYPAVIRQALGADCNVVLAVRNPLNHGIALVSHMLEMVPSSRDMVSRLRRSLLMGLSASTPARALAPRQSGLGSFSWLDIHGAEYLLCRRSRSRGSTTYRPGQSPAARLSHPRT